MGKANHHYLFVWIAVVVIILSILIFSFSFFKNTYLSENKYLINDTLQAKKMLNLADSLKVSKPDSSIYFYNKVIRLSEKSKDSYSKQLLLAQSYLGLAYCFSETGVIDKSLHFDSIGNNYAQQINNYSLQAKALVIRGNIFFRKGEYNAATDYFLKAETLAIKGKDLLIRAKVYSNIAQIYFSSGEETKTIETFKKALRIAVQMKDKPLIAGNLMNLGVVHLMIGKYDKSLSYFKQSLPIFLQINDRNGVLLSYQNIGNLYFWTSKYSDAIEAYELSISIARQMNDKSNVGKGYHNLAEAYARIGEKKKAIDYYFQSVQIKEELGEKKGLALDYTGIGGYYHENKDYPKALEYYRQSLALNTGMNNLQGITADYDNIANVYSSTNRSDSAIAYFNKSLILNKKFEYPVGLSLLYINLGAEYCVRHDYNLAKIYLQKAVTLKSKISDEEGLATAYCHLAEVYLKESESVQGKSRTQLLNQGKDAGTKGYLIAKKVGAPPVIKETALVLKDIYRQQGNYAKSVEFADEYAALNDSLMGKDKTEALIFAEARWNAEKKQHQIEKLQSRQKLNQEIIRRKEEESQQHRLMTYFLISLLLLTIVTATVVVLYIRKRRDELHLKQIANISALRMQNARNSMSPHFFFNLLSSLSGLGSRQDILKERVNSLSLLLRKVIENIDKTAIPLEEELAAVKAYIELYRVNIPEPFTVEYEIEEATNLHRLIPAMAIQIPVENAIKHGLMPLEGAKMLRISIEDFHGFQQIQIADNGVGLRASAGRSMGTGTGLKVLLQTIHLLNSHQKQKITFQIEEQQYSHEISTGTCVTIRIPYQFDFAP